MKETQTVLTPPANLDPRSKSKEATKTFAFDKSYWSFNRKDSNFAGQDDLFADLGKPLLDNAFQGYNNCIFAYGQTGSGKSYSMMGYGQEEGVIPKICRNMFERIEDLQKDANLGCTVEVSYLEIYNERVRDLLNPSTKGNLKVREHPSTGPYVEDLAKLVVRSFAEIENLMDEGNKARTVAATNMNETSSRSHAVFTLTLSQKRHDVETGMDTEKVAKISLVDLAGSERATSTGATGARLKEGAEINRSLSTLGRVIAALADLSNGKKKNASMVPYRDSVLTWLLKDSLGGNSLTAMIAAISPADINFEETLSTLRYADSAKRIKNHAVVNEDPNARMIRELKEELAQLRSKLSSGGTTGGIAEEQYSADTPLDQQIVSLTQADGSVKKVSKAEIAEQLSQSEKLYQDLNQTWEEKLVKTEQIHKEREAALEELGISIEKGFVGLSTPKKMPHLVNLSDDPLLAECLVYNLKPGTTTVGNVDTAQNAEIRLNGSKILHDHCTFENVDGVVTVVPNENAAVMVNGIRIEQPKRLRSGYRIILGDFHIFRFNHPQEARAERAEQGGSMLRHSIMPGEIESPSIRPSHKRGVSNISGVDSDVGSRAESPAPSRSIGRESDWSLARKEAVSAVLGPDQKMSTLTDDELDVLFDDLQKVRAVRRGMPESRLFEMNGDDDTESTTSYPLRERYLSGGTIDNFSLDTALTMPSTPQQHGEDDRLQQVKEEMQQQLDKQKEEYQERLKSAEDSNVEMELIRAEKTKMEDSLRAAKEEMQTQLQLQKEEFERQIKEMRRRSAQPASKSAGLTEEEVHIAKHVVAHWRQQRSVAMATAVLQNAAILKEAQIMSQQMDKHVVFQFTIVDVGNTFGSSYDLVLNEISTEDDLPLERARKPCIAVRVVDFKSKVVHLWSLEKLRARVRLMRQMNQYLDQPEYVKHFRLDNPFSEPCLPEYTRIGDADIPLTAVFQCRVQDFTLDVYSPYTWMVVGIVRLSLEPSSAEAPSSTLKFNVVMHDMIGFAEREGTDVHAQLFFPGISEEDGATTTQMVNGFDEGPVRFESVHSMGLPVSSPRESSLRVSIFAKVTPMHLDKLLSWDDMRDSAVEPRQKRQRSRLGEHEYFTDQRHDVFARVQLLEISEDGTYQPVEVIQNSTMDPGAYQLHQGLQRRIVIQFTHASGDALPWTDLTSVQAGQLHLLDPSGRSPDLTDEQGTIPLTVVSPPLIRSHGDGTITAKIVTQWDSSAHDSVLLDRPTAEKYRVQLSLNWSAVSSKLAEPLRFSFKIAVQMRSRSYIRQTSLFTQLFNSSRIVHSTTGLFSIVTKPQPPHRPGELWRFDTQSSYVKGEETLEGWAPRGVSLVKDFLDNRRKRQRAADVERTKGSGIPGGLYVKASPSDESMEQLDDRQRESLNKIIGAWKTQERMDDAIITSENTEPPVNGAAFAPVPTAAAANSTDGQTATQPLQASMRFVPKNPNVLKSGFMLMPDTDNTRWVRRHLELRRPYLHVHSMPEGDEINAINLTNSRVDHQPEVAKLLKNDNRVPMHVFAVYATTKAWLFATRTESEKHEWILAIDTAYFSSGAGTPEQDGE